ncbi:MAG: glycolate oxidase subunit GlcE [Rhodospirillales bacterium]
MSSMDFKPTNETHVVDAIRWAISEREPLSVSGLGSKSGLGRATNTAHVLDMSAMSGVRYYEPGELVITVAAGTPLSEVEELLGENNQQLAFEPVALNRIYGQAEKGERGTIGGLVAANLAGSRRLKAGAVRDHVLGFKAVSGRGEMFKSGGKVMKNVTGFDLSKLMTGSMGTLAVMTEVTLKVLPMPEKTRTVLVYGVDDDQATRAMTAALNSPHEVSSAVYLPAAVARLSEVGRVGDANTSVVAVRIEGPEPSVLERASEITSLLGGFGRTDELHRTNSQRLWWETSEASYFATGENTPLWRISVEPAKGAVLARNVLSETGGEGYCDWGGGLLTLSIPGNPARSARAIRQSVAAVGGHATLLRASETVRSTLDVFDPQSDGIMALSRRIKKAFDPEGVLNPGRMYATF